MKDILKNISEEFAILNEEKRKIESKPFKTEKDLDDLNAIQSLYQELSEKINSWASEQNVKAKEEIPAEKSLRERFEENRTKLDDLEKYSKSLQPEFNSTDKSHKSEILDQKGFIETTTVDGRKIQLHPSVVGKYYDLTKEQRVLSQQLSEEYRNSQRTKPTVSTEEESVIIEPEVSIENSNPKNVENNLEDHIEALEQRRATLQQERDNILTNERGRKEFYTFKGQKYYIPRGAEGRFANIMSNLDKVDKQIAEYYFDDEMTKEEEQAAENISQNQRYQSLSNPLFEELKEEDLLDEELSPEELNEFDNEFINMRKNEVPNPIELDEINLDGPALNSQVQNSSQATMETQMQKAYDNFFSPGKSEDQNKQDPLEEILKDVQRTSDDFMKIIKNSSGEPNFVSSQSTSPRNIDDILSNLSMETPTPTINENSPEPTPTVKDFPIPINTPSSETTENLNDDFDDFVIENQEYYDPTNEELENQPEYTVEVSPTNINFAEEFPEASPFINGDENKEQNSLFSSIKEKTKNVVTNIRKSKKDMKRAIVTSTLVLATALTLITVLGRQKTRKPINLGDNQYQTESLDQLNRELLQETEDPVVIIDGGKKVETSETETTALETEVETSKTETQTTENQVSANLDQDQTQTFTTENNSNTITQDVQEESTTIHLGTVIDGFQEGTQIYVDEYSAYYQDKPWPMYYGESAKRVVIGVAIQNGDTLNSIYANQENANQKIDDLINNGGEIVAVLTANQEKYLQDYNGSQPLLLDEVKAYEEGWYNINDVMQTNTKGLGR